jgi:hypothetical protein
MSKGLACARPLCYARRRSAHRALAEVARFLQRDQSCSPGFCSDVNDLTAAELSSTPAPKAEK